MFILGDETHDRGRIPWVTFTLLAVNFMVGCAQLRFGDRLTVGFALVPKEVTEFRDITNKQKLNLPGPGDFDVDEDGNLIVHGRSRVHFIQHYPGPFPIVLTFFTYQFLHGDVFHLLFNMWFLFIFGRNVECSLGHGRYIAFYLFCGVMAGIAQVGADASSIVPVIGASGSIAGVMGAYLAIFPWNNIKVVWGGIGLMFGIVEVPAFIVVGMWFFGQMVLGMMTMHNEFGGGGTAFWCHIGGFITGFATIKAIVLYLQYQIRKIEGEKAAEEDDFDDKPRLIGDALEAPDVPTQAQVENMIDPVEAFRRARQGVFRQTPENDPFLRPTISVSPDAVDEELAQGIVVKKE